MRNALVRAGVLHRAGRWTIGVYQASPVCSLRPVPNVRNPVLTADDVTDAPARFVADPFLARENGSWYVFFEICNDVRGTGEIAVAASADGVSWTYQGRVLAEPFHLSYPYVFRHDGAWYMVPETGELRTVRLYRAARFPDRWEHVTGLLTDDLLTDPAESFVDASLVRHAGHWWIFVDTSPAGRSDTLRLFMADALEGPYTEHPASPLVAGDPTRARPGGRIVAHDGGLVRFSQICKPRYGAGIRGFHIRTLSPTAYEEVPLCGDRLLSASGRGWNGMGMHTVDLHPREDGTWLAAVDGLSSNHLRLGRR